MALATLKKIWKNEYLQTVIMSLIILGIVFGFWFGSQLALRTDHPVLAVVSTSMLPTLNVGDLIVVQGMPPEQIYANDVTGDIIVFRSPINPDELIVHRAVESENRDGIYYFTTHGDNNPTGSNEGPFSETYLVGKVIGRIPCLGNFSLFMHTQEYLYLFIIIIIVLIIAFVVFPFGTDEKKTEAAEQEKENKETTVLFGKLNVKTAYLKIAYILIINVLLISCMLLSLWGAFAFFQPGAMPPRDVGVYGMYPDAGFHGSFKISYNNVSEVFLSHGFLSYTINCLVNDGIHTPAIRPGVPTFSWAQVMIIILVVFDVWELIKFLKLKKIL